MPNVIIDRNSTGYKLFNRLFHCRVKAKHLVRLPDGSDETGLLIRAIPTTGDPEFDAHLAESLNDVYLPPSDIAELVEEGADVLIVKRGDIETIYDLIQDHLHWWSHRISQGHLYLPGKSDTITRDLKVLSNCADRLYPMLTEYRKRQELPENVRVIDVNHGRSYAGAIKDTPNEHRSFDSLFDPSVLKQIHSWER